MQLLYQINTLASTMKNKDKIAKHKIIYREKY